MKKYLGIIKVETESMVGIDRSIYTKFSDKKSELKKWFKNYPDSKVIILDNTKKLHSFFEDFEDFL